MTSTVEGDKTYTRTVLRSICIQQQKNKHKHVYLIRLVLQKTVLCLRIHNECECGIEKSVLRITVWHHEACRVMTNVDREGRIVLSHPHTNTGLFFLVKLNTEFS